MDEFRPNLLHSKNAWFDYRDLGPDRWILIKLGWKTSVGQGEEWLAFGDLDPIFEVTRDIRMWKSERKFVWRPVWPKICLNTILTENLSEDQSSLRGWLGWAMVLGSFQCRGVLLLWHVVGQGPTVLAAGAGKVGYIFYLFVFFPSRLSYLPFLMPHLKYCGLGRYNPAVVVSYYYCLLSTGEPLSRS